LFLQDKGITNIYFELSEKNRTMKIKKLHSVYTFIERENMAVVIETYYVLIKTQLDLCQRPSRHRPLRILPQPLLTYAGPKPNFKKNTSKNFIFYFLFI
jgi:hypothetical protein